MESFQYVINMKMINEIFYFLFLCCLQIQCVFYTYSAWTSHLSGGQQPHVARGCRRESADRDVPISVEFSVDPGDVQGAKAWV